MTVTETTQYGDLTDLGMPLDVWGWNAEKEGITWRGVPQGFYAIPVHDWWKFNNECTADGPEPVLELLGFKLFARKVPRVNKNGRTVGRNRFVIGRQILAQGVTDYVERKGRPDEKRWKPWERLTRQTENDRHGAEHDFAPDGLPKAQLCICCEMCRWSAQDPVTSGYVRVKDWQEAYVNCAAACILDGIKKHGDVYRKLYGQVTGKCGICGRMLTDPESKARGIGPDCFAKVRKIAAEIAEEVPAS